MQSLSLNSALALLVWDYIYTHVYKNKRSGALWNRFEFEPCIGSHLTVRPPSRVSTRFGSAGKVLIGKSVFLFI